MAASTRDRLLTAALAVVLPGLLLVGPSPARGEVHLGAGVALEPVDDDVDWTDVLAAAQAAARTTTYRASMTIVQLDVDGPYVTEVPVAHDADGRLRIGEPERWLVGRDRAGEAFFVDGETGTSVRVATQADRSMDVDRIGRHYLVEVVGRARLVGGPALAVTFTRPDAMTPSERVFVDDGTGLVVRRETYDVDGTPVRVVALRDLAVTGEVGITDAGLEDADPASSRLVLSAEGIALLDDAGWVAPDRLAQDFRLTRAAALAAGDTVHLVYSDGLYQVSVYEQVGTLDPDATAGATPYDEDGRRVWRWPGSEPERLVWSGGGRTFTAVSDAPTQRLMQVIGPLPVDAPGGVTARVSRGLDRLGRWLWPLDDGADG